MSAPNTPDNIKDTVVIAGVLGNYKGSAGTGTITISPLFFFGAGSRRVK